MREAHTFSEQNLAKVYHHRKAVVASLDSFHVMFVHTKNGDDFLRFERTPGSP